MQASSGTFDFSALQGAALEMEMAHLDTVAFLKASASGGLRCGRRWNLFVELVWETGTCTGTDLGARRHTSGEPATGDPWCHDAGQ